MDGIPRPGVPRSGRALTALLALFALAVLPACSSGSDPDPGPDGADAASAVTVGLLLPDTRADRYERVDKPAFEARVAKLCPKCDIRYANAGGDPETQRSQAEAMLGDGADILVLSPVDPAAAAPLVAAAVSRGVPVVSYERLAAGAVSGYVTFRALPAANTPAPAADGTVATPDDRAAQLAALRDVLAGKRRDTPYLSYRVQAETVAEMAVAHVRGRTYAPAETRTGNVPTVLVPPVDVTRSRLRDTVVDDGRFTTAELCAPPLADRCDKAGLT
jgi:ABC-type xylose transport system substrate-binding protein